MKEKLAQAWERFEASHKTAAKHIQFFLQMLFYVVLCCLIVGSLTVAVGMLGVFGVWLKWWAILVIPLWIAFCLTVGRAVAPWIERHF